MSKKTTKYTLLANIDHKVMQYVNLIGIIDDISPAIKRNKTLGYVIVELCDATLYRPGFITNINLCPELLDQFMSVAKRGLIIELLYIKVVKSDGRVYGEVYNQDELHMYNDEGTHLSWGLGGNNFPTLYKVKHLIEDLCQWKYSNFDESSEVQQEATTIEIMSNSKGSTSQTTSKHLRARTRNSSSTTSIHSCPSSSSQSICRNRKQTNSTEYKNLSDDSDLSILDVYKENETSVSEIYDSNEMLTPSKNITILKINRDTKELSPSRLSRSCLRRTQSLGILPSLNNTGKYKPISSSKLNIDSKNESTSSETDSSNDKITPPNGRNTVSSSNKAHAESESKKRSREELSSSGSAWSTPSPLLLKDPQIHNTRKYKFRPSTKLDDKDKDDSSFIREGINIEEITMAKRRKLKHHVQLSSESQDSNSTPLSSTESITILKKTTFDSNIQVSSDCSSIKGNGSRASDAQSKNKTTTTQTNDYKTPTEKRKHISCGNDDPHFKSGNTMNKQEISKTGSNMRKSKSLSDLKSTSNSRSGEIKPHRTSDVVNKLYKAGDYVQKTLNKSKKDDQGSKKQTSPVTSKIKRSKAMNKSGNNACNDSQYLKMSSSSDEDKSPDEKSMETLKYQKRINQNTSTTGMVCNKPIGRRKMIRVSPTKNKVGNSPSKEDMFDILAPLCRKLYIDQVEYMYDISQCDIENIDVPEKFDLQCKVVSKFTLFENHMQIVRVQDGTVSKAHTLSIPRRDTWDEVVAAILRNPNIKANSPYIDIIIFEFARMDVPLIVGKYYNIQNVMGCKLQLKEDPRKSKTINKRGELFFWAKGHNTYLKKLSSKPILEIESKLKEDKYKGLIAAFDGNKEVDLEQLRDGCEKNKSMSPLTSDEVFPNKKKRLSDTEYPCDEEKVKDAMKTVIDNKSTTGKGVSPNRKKEQMDKKILHESDNLQSSDETILDESYCSNKKELYQSDSEPEIILQQMFTEDIHLKNSSSELTFSQFCQGSMGKATSFKTSSQEHHSIQDGKSDQYHIARDKLIQDLTDPDPTITVQSDSEPYTQANNVSTTHNSQNDDECTTSLTKLTTSAKSIPTQLVPDTAGLQEDIISQMTPESDKMDSLVNNCSSKLYLQADNLQSTNYEINDKEQLERLEKEEEIRLSAESDKMGSLVYNPSTSSLSEAAYSVTLTTSQEICQDFNKCSESILEKTGSYQCNSSNPVSHAYDTNCEAIENISLDSVEILASSDSSEVHIITVKTCVNKSKDIVTSCTGVSVCSEQNSSDNISPSKSSVNGEPKLSIEDNECEIIERTCVENSENSIEVNNIKTPLFSVMDINSTMACPISSEYQANQEKKKNIPKDCFFVLSNESHLSSKVYVEEQDVELLCCSQDTSLPIMTVEFIKRVQQLNLISVSVILESISPPISDKWLQECIKSRCSSCNKFYNSYNALNNIFTYNSEALLVGGQVVCPDSQCCNKVLGSPEFYLNMKITSRKCTRQEVKISRKCAENLFGCKAREAARDKSIACKIIEILLKISDIISKKQIIVVDFTPDNILDISGAPLVIEKIHNLL